MARLDVARTPWTQEQPPAKPTSMILWLLVFLAVTVVFVSSAAAEEGRPIVLLR